MKRMPIEKYRPYSAVDLPDRRWPSQTSRELLKHLIKSGGAKFKEPLFISIFEKEDFNILCKIAIEHQNLCLILDEVDMFDSPHSQDRDFKKLIHYGRHYKVDLVTTSRRPHNVSRDLTSQTGSFSISSR